MSSPIIVLTATGTAAGKTFLTRALTSALRARAVRVAALKPCETGCSPDALDAIALARASGIPAHAAHPGFFRSTTPVSPYAACLLHAQPPLHLPPLAHTISDLARDYDLTLVEGAGGLLAPLTRDHTIAELALRLHAPLLLLAPDRLGVLSHVLTAVESARARGLRLLAVVLVQLDRDPDPSTQSNYQILTERLPCPVVRFPHCADDDAALAAAAERTGLLPLVLGA